MRLSFYIFYAFLFISCAVSAENVKNITVNDFLKQAGAQASLQGRKANNLINESSPYLLQHAYNPVDWYAWGDLAFDKARKENKPIFLSIGYSTCHWCHVMAHESFENEIIAEILNKYFISIKVDREQRPDIDSVYMLATRLINGHGGWPMSVFLDHKLRPFHAGTYYPPHKTVRAIGLEDVLLIIHELWLNKPEEIERIATTVTARISAMADDVQPKEPLVKDINKLALQQITESYDKDYAGFSAAPKFPRPGIFSFLNKFASTDEKNAQYAAFMMSETLDAMADGGLYDQVAGGFHRYSVDDRWQVPHFEKMLYSQALT